MNVAAHLQRDAITALPTAPLSAVREVMEDHGFGLLLVADEEGKLRGFVTRGSLKGVTDWNASVETVSHPARFAVHPDDTLEKAALIMLENRLVLLPVTQENGTLVGTITQSEVLRGLAAGLGIGLEGTRLTLRLRRETNDLYRALRVLEAHGVRLVSLVEGGSDESAREVIVRVQGSFDREQLKSALEACLSSSA